MAAIVLLGPAPAPKKAQAADEQIARLWPNSQHIAQPGKIGYCRAPFFPLR